MRYLKIFALCSNKNTYYRERLLTSTDSNKKCILDRWWNSGSINNNCPLMKKFSIDKKFSADEKFSIEKKFLERKKIPVRRKQVSHVSATENISRSWKTNSRPTKYFITTFSYHSFYSLWSQLWEIWSGGVLEEAFAFAIEWDKTEYLAGFSTQLSVFLTLKLWNECLEKINTGIKLQ